MFTLGYNFLFESILGHCGKPLYHERKLSKKPLNMVQITHIVLCHFKDDAGFAQSHGVMHTKRFKVFRFD